MDRSDQSVRLICKDTKRRTEPSGPWIPTDRCFFHHLASKDPYQDNERLQWSWTSSDASKLGLFLCWTHGNVTFKGDLIMYINTKRKVGNITFLELPNIKMEWKMEWNGTTISVWNMEMPKYGMEWKILIMEWKIFSIIPYFFHTYYFY